MTAAFAPGDQVCVVGKYRPAQGTGTVTALLPHETYDVWARFGEHDYPFRADELALALEVEGEQALMNAMAEAVPGGPVAFFRAARLGALVGMVLLLGFFAGFLAAPVQTVEVRTTVTHAVPPACAAEARASSIERTFRETRDAHNDAVLQHTIDAFEAQVYGNVDAMVDAQGDANDEKLLRDAAERAREGAQTSAEQNGTACLTHTEPVRVTEQVAK